MMGAKSVWVFSKLGSLARKIEDFFSAVYSKRANFFPYHFRG